MSDDPHSRGGPPTYVQPGAVSPSHAERTRTLVHGENAGTLSTMALDPAGYPFGSVVTYALDQQGAPLILMSTMAEHARNLDDDPRCSLLVTASGDGAGRLAAARATLIGTMHAIEGAAQEEATKAYVTAHPGAFWAKFPDFAVRRLDVLAIRYVRGFGEMSWVPSDEYGSAGADPVAPSEAGIVSHMNDDHRENLRQIATHFLPDVAGTVREVQMLSCDRYGFEVRFDLEPGSSGDGNDVAFGRIGFTEPLSTAAGARAGMVTLVQIARGQPRNPAP